jgi:hypothetical protein
MLPNDLNNGGPLPQIQLPSDGALQIGVRLSLAIVGAFLTGVFPGGILVAYLIASWPVHPGIGTFLMLYVLFASVGACSGIVAYRLISWSSPTMTDLYLVFGSGLLFGILGLALLVYFASGT